MVCLHHLTTYLSTLLLYLTTIPAAIATIQRPTEGINTLVDVSCFDSAISSLNYSHKVFPKYLPFAFCLLPTLLSFFRLPNPTQPNPAYLALHRDAGKIMGISISISISIMQDRFDGQRFCSQASMRSRKLYLGQTSSYMQTLSQGSRQSPRSSSPIPPSAALRTIDFTNSPAGCTRHT